MSYAALVEYQRRLWQLRHVEAFVAWDEATMMPEGGGAARAEALSALRGLIHQQASPSANRPGEDCGRPTISPVSLASFARWSGSSERQRKHGAKNYRLLPTTPWSTASSPGCVLARSHRCLRA